jgi:hypothetical protein
MASAVVITIVVLLAFAAPRAHQGTWGALAQPPPVFPEQRQALVELYLACNGSSWSSLNQFGWADYTDPSNWPCEWTGVNCQTDYSENQSFITCVQWEGGGRGAREAAVTTRSCARPGGDMCHAVWDPCRCCDPWQGVEPV